MARRRRRIGPTAFPNATIIGFMRRPDRKGGAERTHFKISASRTSGAIGKYSIERSIKTSRRRRNLLARRCGRSVGFYDARRRSRDGAARVAHTPSTVSASAPNSTGLMRNGVEPGGRRGASPLVESVGGQGDNGRRRPAAGSLEPPQTARGLVAVETWHLEVHQDDVEGPRFERRDRRGQTQRLFAVECANDLEAQAAHRLLGNESIDVVVFGDEGAAD